jgi:3-isopropylmalate/(R)-2-methylmalate dehydratase small subunit
MVLKGKTWKFGDDISTDLICPGRYFHLRSNLPELATHVLEDVLAKSFARIFYRNAINVGLPLVECDTNRIETGDELEVDLAAGVVRDKTKGIELKAHPLPKAMINILNDGGLLPHLEKHGGFKLD